MQERIKKLRTDKKLLQKDIANILNCSQVTYSMYECGTRKIPVKVIIKLAKFYNVSTNYILGLPKLSYPNE
ncbi:MAG: helix-turn-helix transcriptional regulator [Clostridia bacterium]|nr:helix-turn-helix transcriptional regulator [Clostridia bacterium]